MFKDFKPPKGYKLLITAPNYIIGELVYNLLTTSGLHPQILSSSFPYTDPVYMGRGLPVYIIVPENEFEEAKRVIEEENIDNN